MNKKPLSRCSRIVGYRPNGKDSFVLVESKVSPVSVDVPGLFRADGVHIDFEGGDYVEATTLWFTMSDARALVEHLDAVIDEVSSGQATA
jgi:hypothetical protein